jgi:uncharacterized membrane protein
MNDRTQEEFPDLAPRFDNMDSNVEDELFGKWFPRIGALALVLGAGFGFKYAIDQGWIGPRLRVMCGLLLASILIGIGDWTRKREWSAYAQAITGGGVALLYLTLWATVGVYDLLPVSVAFVCLVGVSGLGCVLALRHESQALALLSVIGGFVNPFVTGAGTEMPQGLYLYTLTVDLAVVVLSFVRPWRLLEKVAFVSSWLVFEAGGAGPQVSLLAATGIFIMFGALPYVRVLLNTNRGISDLAIVPLNGLIYYFAVFVRLEGELAGLRGPFTLAIAGFFLAGLLIVRERGDDDLIGASSGVMSFMFLTLWWPIELGVSLTPLGWSIQALVLFGVAVVSKEQIVRGAAWISLTFAGVAQLFWAATDPVGSVNQYYGRFVFMAVIAGLYIAAHLERDDLWSDLRGFALVAANLLSLLWLSIEVYSSVSDGGARFPSAADLQFGLSGVWALYAAGLLTAGMFVRSRLARLMSLALFGIVLVKMAVHDLWLLDTLQRLIGFAGIGILLLACSLMYHRFRGWLLPDDAQTGGAA